MHIVVCMKQILDPEIPSSYFEIDPIRKVAVENNASRVISTFDECALEVALQMQSAVKDAVITGITLGSAQAEAVLRHALAMRCDKVVRVNVDEETYLDSIQVATLLAGGIQILEPADLILFGREAGDWGCGHVGPMVAQLLGRPFLSNVSNVNVDVVASHFEAKRYGSLGWERCEVDNPAVMTVTNSDENVPRFPSVRDTMQARRRPILVLKGKDLMFTDGALANLGSPVIVQALYIPESSDTCELVSGITPEEKVLQLVEKIQALKLL